MRSLPIKCAWSLLSLLLGLGAIDQARADFASAVTNTPNLLGYWNFDPPVPTNSLVNSFAGTNEGTATIGGPGSGSPLGGDSSNQGLVLDGAGYMASDLTGLITNEFTLMAWINASSYPGSGGNDSYFEIVDQQAQADDCDLILFPDGTVHFYTDQGGNVATPQPIPANQWHFIVGTATNNGPRRIYVDGQLVGANISGPHHVSAAPFWVGYGPVFTPRHFVGSIDDAAVFNRALTGAEVVSLYLASQPAALGTLQSVVLNISAQMPIGGTLQSSVIAKFSSGTNFDVTGLAAFSSSDTSVLTVTPGGLVAALKAGSATVTAHYNNLAAAQVINVIVPSATLTHRYSFSSGNANDSVGTANGALRGAASFTGGGLSLNGSSSVTLPAGIIDSNYYGLSIEMWATLQRTTSGNVNVAAAFGNAAGSYVRLGTHNGGGDGNAWIGDNNGFGTEVLGFQPGPVNGTVYLAAVWNPAAGHMEFYENGELANGNALSASLAALSSELDVSNVIGANIDGTSGVVGSIQEFRIYSGALSVGQVHASYAAGPANPPLLNNQIEPGAITSVSVTTHTNFIVGTTLDPVVTASSASVQSINVTRDATVSFSSSDNSVFQVTSNNQILATGAGSATLTATYGGKSGTTLVTTIAAPSLMLTHHYAFGSDASDSISQENGTLMGNATVSSGLHLNQEGDGNGTGDFLELPRDLTGNYPAITVEAWVDLGQQTTTYSRVWNAFQWAYGTGVTASTMLLSPDFGGPDGSSLTLYDNPAYGVTPADEMDIPVDGLSSPISIQSAGKTQLVGVLDPDNGVATLYVNGQLAGTSKFIYPLSGINVDRVWIGKSGSINDPLLIGSIDDLRFYYGAMTPGQVASNYVAGSTSIGVNVGAVTIVDQPQSRTALAGTSVTFKVGAIGAPPLSYQWYDGSNPIPGANAASYSVHNISSGNAGSYSVQVSNALSLGSPVASQAAVLTVQPQADLTTGLLVYLPFDGNFDDASGANNPGQAGGSPSFIPGKVGNAVHLSTAPPAFNYVSIPNSAGFSFAGDFTVAQWQRHTGLLNDLPLVGNAKNSTYQFGWVLTDDQGRLEGSFDSSGFILIDPAPGPVIDDGQWHQVAFVVNEEAEQLEIFVDGNEVASRPTSSLGTSLLGDLTTPFAVTIGQDPTGTYGVPGQYDVDEFAIWNRALAPSDLQTAYMRGVNGQSFTNGSSVGPVTLTVQASVNGALVSWSAGTLESAPAITGPWAPVAGAQPPSYQYSPTANTNQFFRVLVSGNP